MARKLVLIVVDGMTPAAFERAVEGGRAPALALLAAHGSYRRATSVFPSLTPVCLSSIATGSTPAVHHIPHLVWWHRDERRIVEYGSSFSALRAAGMAQSIADTIYNMNAEHLSRDAETIFETLENEGLVTAAVNITCYRGHTKHVPTLPWVTKAAYGPTRFFYYSLFESDRTGAPLAVRNRAAGSIDVYAAAVGRWLVTRDGFDMLAYYLSDFDYASHAYGPEGAEDVALERTDAAIQALIDSAGGGDAFFERYAVVLLSDHGQTRVTRAAPLEAPLAAHADSIVVAASNRAGQIYLLPDARVDAPAIAHALDADAAVDVTLWREGDDAVARREREELRFRPADDGWETSGDASILDQPDALHRAWQALANPNAGEVLVSAAPDWEFVDLGGRHHAGGGSHGSLVEGDSIVPVVTVGIDAEIERITDVAPALISHASHAAPV
jgi:Type I phosphodiesterase / nucleotide pyrophosphatase